MDERDATLIEKLARENEEFRRLLDEHRSLEKDLEQYEHKPYLTASQSMERARLKKLKLLSKDKMEAILRQYRSSV